MEDVVAVLVIAWSPIIVGHAGPGSVWQAMVVIAGIVLAGTAVAVAAGRLRIERPTDLIAPAAATLAAASLGALGHMWISDGISWGLPIAIIAAGALVLHVATPLRLEGLSPLAGATLAVGMVSAVMLSGPLTMALHPPVEALPLAGDAEIAIVAPSDGDQVDREFALVVRVNNATIGPGAPTLEEWAQSSDDPTQMGVVVVSVDGDRYEVGWDPACTVNDPCQQTSAELTLPTGPSTITVEFVRGDGTPLAPAVTDRIRIVID